MASVIFTGIDALRMVLETETDADSPDNETTYGAIRKAIECLFLLLLGTGDSGSATSDPPDNTTGVLTDTGAAYTIDEHIGRTLLITSGNARGNIYTIDDNAATTLTCTDDNLYSDGVRSADDYVILYDTLVNTDGHDHDDVNSKPVMSVDDAAIGQSELHTSEVSVSTAGASNLTLTGAGQYGFYPQTYKSGGGTMSANICATASHSSYATILWLSVLGSGGTAYAKQLYVTSSGEVYWVFILRAKVDLIIDGVNFTAGSTLAMWQSPDHPCFGSNKPELLQHPFPDFDDTKHEIICINPTDEEVKQIRAKAIMGTGVQNKDFLEVIADEYEIDDTVQPAYPDIKVTVGLPDNWQELPMGTKVVPIKKRILQPPMVRTSRLKNKARKVGPGQ